MRRVIVAIAAVTFALAGPRLFGESRKARDAGEPFVYAPPEGFTEDKAGAKEGARLFVHSDNRETEPAVVVVHHTPNTVVFAEGDLERLVGAMPKAFEDAKCAWVHRRHEMRTRADGARVGLIEGDCNREVDMSAIGIDGKRKLHTRKLQLLFPDDTGMSIATASYRTEEAMRWEPAFEATIATAKGVATRYPQPNAQAYAMWGAAGAILGWLAAALIGRGSKEKKEA